MGVNIYKILFLWKLLNVTFFFFHYLNLDGEKSATRAIYPNHWTPKLKYKDFKEGKIRLDIWKKLITKVEEAAQRSCGYLSPGGVQGQVRCVIEQTGLLRGEFR